ncbi:hypothetical protein ABVC79_07295 [Xanthomonas euvesicatoria]|uniref:hypothetical protein n=1 Tax=Xanthomonas TaxID=338 RepID=UPI0001FD4ACB|nr:MULTISPECIES: hypothetical protein [Xanthomonas]NEK68445.1 hypothetical protein [Xanthomonas perforans]
MQWTFMAHGIDFMLRCRCTDVVWPVAERLTKRRAPALRGSSPALADRMSTFFDRACAVMPWRIQ